MKSLERCKELLEVWEADADEIGESRAEAAVYRAALILLEAMMRIEQDRKEDK